jgi:hypothetical protein
MTKKQKQRVYRLAMEWQKKYSCLTLNQCVIVAMQSLTTPADGIVCEGIQLT